MNTQTHDGASYSPILLDLIHNVSIIKQLKKGQLLHLQNDPSSCFYIVKSGQFRSFVISEDGRQVTLEIFSAGELLGGASYFNHLPRPTSMSAVSNAEVYCVRLEDLLPHLVQHPQLIGELLGMMGKSTFPLSIKISSMAFHSADKRVASILLQMGKFYKQSPENNSYTIPHTHASIAELAGINRVTATRVLQTFAQNNWVALHYKRIQVLQESALEAFLHTPSNTK